MNVEIALTTIDRDWDLRCVRKDPLDIGELAPELLSNG